MKIEALALPGLLIITPDTHRDSRGEFRELWHEQRYREAGLPTFVQDNLVTSTRGVLRGLHYQFPREQGKLDSVLAGSIYDVVVDIRVGSPAFGRAACLSLDAERGLQLYIPPGYAHGYATTSESATVAYKCSDFYDPDSEGSVYWNDPALGIEWPVQSPETSEKDRRARPLGEIPPHRLPRFSR
jgi:dTDP-4-dehydrorhamnose 3,5-epimerase